MDELFTLAGALDLTVGDLLGDSIVSARVPEPSYIEGQGRNKRKVAPIGFVPNGATFRYLISTETREDDPTHLIPSIPQPRYNSRAIPTEVITQALRRTTSVEEEFMILLGAYTAYPSTQRYIGVLDNDLLTVINTLPDVTLQ